MGSKEKSNRDNVNGKQDGQHFFFPFSFRRKRKQANITKICVH